MLLTLGASARAQALEPPSIVSCPSDVWPDGVVTDTPPEVALLVHLTAEGLVARITDVVGPEPFAALAMESVKACTFSPAREEGVPVPVVVPFTWAFTSPEPPATTPQTELSPSATSGGEVVGSYTPTPPKARVVDQATIKDTPGTLGDPIRALQTRPGLLRTPFDAGWVLVRGGDFDHTSLHLDGAPVPLLFHLGGFTSVLHPELTERVEFHPGVAPARYGDALAGTVDVHTRPVGDDFRAITGVNLVFAHLYGEAPAGDGGVAVAARRSYLDGILTAALDAERAKIAPRFTDVQLRVDQGPTRWTLVGLDDRFDAPTDGGVEETVEVAQQGLQLVGVVDAEPVEVRPRVGWSGRSVSGAVSDERLTELTGGARTELHGLLGGTLEARGGVDAAGYAWALTTDGVERRSPGVRAEPFVQLESRGRVQSSLGLRGTLLQVSDHELRHGVSPRAGAALRLSQRWTAATELARVLRAPRTTLLVGTPEGRYLSLEQADTVSLGGRYASPEVTLELDAWARSMSHLAGFEFDGSVDGQLGDARGLEAQLQTAQGPVTGSAMVQLTRSRRWEDPQDTPELWLLDQPLRIDLQSRWSAGRGWQLAARWRFSSGFPAPGPGPSGEPATALDLLRQVREPLDNSGRLPPYHTLDVRFRKRWLRGPWTIDASLDLQNVYNRRVPEPVITGFGESRYGYGYGLPILPIFGVEGRWTRPPRG